MAQVTLVLGGMRSGKSRFSEALARTSPPVTYLATAHSGDSEMSERIARHRQRRLEYGPTWQCVEEPRYLVDAIRAYGTAGCVLLECLTLWISNRLLATDPGLSDAEVLAEVDAVIEAASTVGGRVIVVSSEVGSGIVPMQALARRFGDLLGEANQRLAAAAAEVHLCVAGIPVRIK